MLGLHADNTAIYYSTGRIIKEPPYLGSLIEIEDDYKIAYDIDAFTASLCRLIQLTKEECEKLIRGKLYIENGFRLTYFSGKMFSVKRGMVECIIVNANQQAIMETHYKKDEDEADGLAKAYLALETGQRILGAYKTLKLNTDSLISPISAFLSTYKLDLPTADDMPEEVSELAWRCAKGGWIETYTMGQFDAYDYDLNGAYGYWLGEIPQFKRGRWVQSTEIPDFATIGFAEGILTINESFHPYIVKVGDESYTPTGTFPNTLTLAEIKTMRAYKKGEFEIKNGWWWLSGGEIYHPYLGAVKHLWEQKQKSTGITKSIITRLYASLYGHSLMTIAKNGKAEFGKNFCPAVGATVEANTRMQVYRACMDNNIVPLTVMTDGFIADKEVNLSMGNDIGQWKLSHQGKVIINSSNQIAFQGKDEGAGELALYYDWFINEINKKPHSKMYAKDKYAPVTIAKALVADFNDLGKVEISKRVVHIGEEYKRMFINRPKNGADLVSGKRFESISQDYNIISRSYSNIADTL